MTETSAIAEVNFFPASCQWLYHKNSQGSWFNTGLAVKYLKTQEINFGPTELFYSQTEADHKKLQQLKVDRTDNLLEIMVIEQHDYTIYLLKLRFSRGHSDFAHFEAYLSNFQADYLAQLEQQIGTKINFDTNLVLQVLFVYDRLTAGYCSFQQFNSNRQHRSQSVISNLHLEATILNHGLCIMQNKGLYISVAKKLDQLRQQFVSRSDQQSGKHTNQQVDQQAPINNHCYESIAISYACYGHYDDFEQDEDETQEEFERRKVECLAERDSLLDRIKDFDLYHEQP